MTSDFGCGAVPEISFVGFILSRPLLKYVIHKGYPFYCNDCTLLSSKRNSMYSISSFVFYFLFVMFKLVCCFFNEK